MNATTHLGVGIDTARYGHHVSFMDEEKRTAAKPFHFNEDAAGYQMLRKALDALVKKHPHVLLHIHIDAAGQYAENLLQWLHRQDLPAVISVGQPARNKAYRTVHYDKRKADPVESQACARFGVVERPRPTPPQAPAFAMLRDTVAQMEASAKTRTRLINQLHNLLARAFPELAVQVKDISQKAILKLLERYPTAQRVAAAKLSSLQSIPHLKPELAAKLHEAAKQSTASSTESFTELLIKQKVQAIFTEFDAHDELAEIAGKILESLPAGPHQRIRTIPGIGPQTEAALVAKIVSIDRFASASALIGYFGVFPEEVDVSGINKDGTSKTGTTSKMSSKGNDMVRRLLYTAAQVAVVHNPPVRALFARLRAADKSYHTAIGHCMAKLLRQVFALWNKDCDFDPKWEEAPPAKEQEAVAGHKKADEPHEQVVTATASSITPASGARRPAIHFAELRRQVSIAQVLDLLRWPMPGGGKSFRGPCPIHGNPGEKDRSLAVNLTKNVYCCHHCGSSGNALDLWAASMSLPLLEAAWDLIERLDIEPPLLNRKEELSDAK